MPERCTDAGVTIRLEACDPAEYVSASSGLVEALEHPDGDPGRP
jgi:hypothetical protein